MLCNIKKTAIVPFIFKGILNVSNVITLCKDNTDGNRVNKANYCTSKKPWPGPRLGHPKYVDECLPFNFVI